MPEIPPVRPRVVTPPPAPNNNPARATANSVLAMQADRHEMTLGRQIGHGVSTAGIGAVGGYGALCAQAALAEYAGGAAIVKGAAGVATALGPVGACAVGVTAGVVVGVYFGYAYWAQVQEKNRTIAERTFNTLSLQHDTIVYAEECEKLLCELRDNLKFLIKHHSPSECLRLELSTLYRQRRIRLSALGAGPFEGAVCRRALAYTQQLEHMCGNEGPTKKRCKKELKNLHKKAAGDFNRMCNEEGAGRKVNALATRLEAEDCVSHAEEHDGAYKDYYNYTCRTLTFVVAQLKEEQVRAETERQNQQRATDAGADHGERVFA